MNDCLVWALTAVLGLLMGFLFLESTPVMGPTCQNLKQVIKKSLTLSCQGRHHTAARNLVASSLEGQEWHHKQSRCLPLLRPLHLFPNDKLWLQLSFPSEPHFLFFSSFLLFQASCLPHWGKHSDPKMPAVLTFSRWVTPWQKADIPIQHSPQVSLSQINHPFPQKKPIAPLLLSARVHLSRKHQDQRTSALSPWSPEI